MASLIFSHMYKAATGDDGTRRFEMKGIEAVIEALANSPHGVSSGEGTKILSALGGYLDEPLAYALAEGLLRQSADHWITTRIRLEAVRSILASSIAVNLVHSSMNPSEPPRRRTDLQLQGIDGLSEDIQVMANAESGRRQFLGYLIDILTPDDAIYRSHIENMMYEVTEYVGRMTQFNLANPSTNIPFLACPRLRRLLSLILCIILFSSVVLMMPKQLLQVLITIGLPL